MSAVVVTEAVGRLIDESLAEEFLMLKKPPP